MSSKLKKSLQDAIFANSKSLVKDYLEQGCDPNGSTLFENDFKSDIDDADDDDDDDDDSPKRTLKSTTSKFCGFRCDVMVPFLIQAIRNCYDNYQAPNSSSAKEILQLLLNHGANVSSVCVGIHCLNFEGWQHHGLHDKNAIDFAVLLKQNISTGYSSRQDHSNMMESVISMLMTAEKDAGHVKPAMQLVPTATLKTWKSLLLNETFSDVHFICGDKPDQKLFAHKCILAAASPYFVAALSGNWQETSQDGIKTGNSFAVMKAALCFIYTGDLNKQFLNDHTLQLLSLAAEWQLPTLITLCEQRCIQTLSLKNVKDTMQLANLHGCRILKDACFTFVKRNTGKLLTSKKFTSLRGDNPKLWRELKVSLGGDDDSESESEEGGDEEDEDEKSPTEASNKRQKTSTQ